MILSVPDPVPVPVPNYKLDRFGWRTELCGCCLFSLFSVFFFFFFFFWNFIQLRGSSFVCSS